MSSRHWFLPESTDLLGMLQAQAAITVEGMDALVDWSAGDADAAARVRECEHRADDSKRALWRTLRHAFSPPLDAEDVFTLSADLDEVLNAAKDLVGEMDVMQMAPDPPTHEIVVLIAEAVHNLAGAFACLGQEEGDPTAFADAAIKGRRRVEHAYRPAMSALLEVSDLREVMSRREAYRRLSRIGELVHRVADRVWYAVVKEA